MEVTYQRIDLEQCRLYRHAPQTVIDRTAGQIWAIPTQPVMVAGSFDWSYCRSEDLVHVPLVPYLLRPEPETALSFMLALGVRAASELKERVRRIHIASGVPVEQFAELDEHGFGLRLYIGFALLLEYRMAKLEDLQQRADECTRRIGSLQREDREVKAIFQQLQAAESPPPVELRFAAGPQQADDTSPRVLALRLSPATLQELVIAEAERLGREVLAAWDELASVLADAQATVAAIRQQATQQADSA
jgi:hypothetical protein